MDTSIAVSSPFVGGRILLGLALPPSALGRGDASARQALTELLYKYSSALGGFLLAFSNAHFDSSGRHALAGGGSDVALGRIFAEQPVVHARIAAEVLIFRPTVGAILRARATALGDGHIGALIAGHFNVMVRAKDMADGYAWDEVEGAWVSTDVRAAAVTARMSTGAGAGVGASASTDAGAAGATGKKRRRPTEEDETRGSVAGVSGSSSGALLAANPAKIRVGDVIFFRVRNISTGGGAVVVEGAFNDDRGRAGDAPLRK